MSDKGRKPVKVLLVEGERRYRTLMTDALQLQGYEILEAADGKTALDLATSQNFDVVLLDLALPDMDGFAVCQRLREFIRAPIIIVTAKAADQDKVRALDIGADDYITKPFSVAELLARVRVSLRRSSSQTFAGEPVSLRFGDLRIDDESRRVLLGPREILLSPVEYRLLWLLASNAGRTLVPDVFAERVWNMPDGDIRGVLKTTIGRLRRKLGDVASNPTYIHSRRGIGYLFSPDA